MKQYFLCLLIVGIVNSCCCSLTDDCNGSDPEPDLISDEIFIGEPSKESYINILENSNNNDLYFAGIFSQSNTTYTVNVGNTEFSSANFAVNAGCFSPSLLQTVEEHPAFTIRNIAVFEQGPGKYNNSIILSGNTPKEFDYQGEIVIYDNYSGHVQFLDEKYLTWYSKLIYINRDENLYYFIAVGGVYYSNTRYPYICEIVFNAETETLEKLNDYYYDFPGQYFIDIEISYLTNGDYRYFFSLSEYDSDFDNLLSSTIVCADESFTTSWERDLASGGYPIGLYYNNLEIDASKVYIAGYVKDDEYWSSGYVASFYFDGTNAWRKTINFSNSADNYYTLKLHGNNLYIAGIMSSYFSSDEENNPVFGNALITKINSNNGDIEGSYTFGNEHYQSGFMTIEILDNYIYAGGWTKRKYLTSGFQAWLVKMNLF